MAEKQLNGIVKEIRSVEQASIDSTYRSIALLEGSEEIADVTVNELDRQGRKLEEVNRQMYDVQDSVATSHLHIKEIKSGVFGGIKKLFHNKKADGSKSPNKIEKTAKKPSPKHKRDVKQVLHSHTPPENKEDVTGNDELLHGKEESSFRSHDADEILDQNLLSMQKAIARLSTRAHEMNFELGGQDELIDEITKQVITSGINISRGTKKLRKLNK